jgi:hypothetical protein
VAFSGSRGTAKQSSSKQCFDKRGAVLWMRPTGPRDELWDDDAVPASSWTSSSFPIAPSPRAVIAPLSAVYDRAVLASAHNGSWCRGAASLGRREDAKRRGGAQTFDELAMVELEVESLGRTSDVRVESLTVHIKLDAAQVWEGQKTGPSVAAESDDVIRNSIVLTPASERTSVFPGVRRIGNRRRTFV